MVKLRIRNRLSLEEKSVRHRGVALRPAVGEILLLTLTLTLTLRPAVGESLLQYSCDVVIPHPQDMVPVKILIYGSNVWMPQNRIRMRVRIKIESGSK